MVGPIDDRRAGIEAQLADPRMTQGIRLEALVGAEILDHERLEQVQ
jgi:hypothetical protein